MCNFFTQRAKKVVSDSPGLVDLAVGLVNSVINLPDGQVNFLGGNSNYRRTVINPAHQIFGGLLEMTLALVHASYSLPEWQAVKLTFFAPCLRFTVFLFSRRICHFRSPLHWCVSFLVCFLLL